MGSVEGLLPVDSGSLVARMEEQMLLCLLVDYHQVHTHTPVQSRDVACRTEVRELAFQLFDHRMTLERFW